MTGPDPFIFFDSPLYRVTMYHHGQSPRLALLQKERGRVVEFCDGDVCRLVADLEAMNTGNPWEDMALADSYLTVFDFQSTGMIH